VRRQNLVGWQTVVAFAAAFTEVGCDERAAAPSTQVCSHCGGAREPACALENAALDDQCLSAVATYDGATDLTLSVQWSPIDDYVLSGAHGQLRLLRLGDDRASFELVSVFLDLGGRTFVAWSPDGMSALSASTSVRLLSIDREAGAITEAAPPLDSDGEVYALAWAPDGNHALSAGEDGIVRLFRADATNGTLEEVASFDGFAGRAYDLSFSPDGSFVAVANEDGTLRVLAVDLVAPSLREASRIAENGPVTAVRWSPRGDQMLSGTWLPCHTVELLSVDPGTTTLVPTSLFAGHSSGIKVLEPRASGDLAVTAGHDDTLRLFAVTPNGMLRELAIWLENPHGVHQASWSPDGTHLVVAASNRDRVTLLDASGCAAQ
jgi:WD40 repeat protein